LESSEKGWGRVFSYGGVRRILTLYVVGYKKDNELKRKNNKE
jgi:hypothetical protein